MEQQPVEMAYACTVEMDKKDWLDLHEVSGHLLIYGNMTSYPTDAALKKAFEAAVKRKSIFRNISIAGAEQLEAAGFDEKRGDTIATSISEIEPKAILHILKGNQNA